MTRSEKKAVIESMAEKFMNIDDLEGKSMTIAESKKAAGEQEQNAGYTDAGDGFMNIPDGVDEQLPFA